MCFCFGTVLWEAAIDGGGCCNYRHEEGLQVVLWELLGKFTELRQASLKHLGWTEAVVQKVF